MPPSRLILVAIAGPTCSGKTTLAALLNELLPNSSVLHQDDFAPFAEDLPIHPVLKVQDWDDAPGAIKWEQQRETIRYLRSHDGAFPPSHSSHDHLNIRNPVDASAALQAEWRAKFERLPADVQFVICDGFLMLWDEESVREFDLRFFVREDYDVLKKRRDERSGYVTADGVVWRDPPGYWDGIVWPSYISAHAPLFLNGDVINGDPNPEAIEGLHVLEARELSIDEMLDRSCKLIWQYVESGKTAHDWHKP